MKQILRHIILLFILFLGGLQFASAQWDTTWIKTYGGNRDDIALDIITTPDNGFMVIGSTSSFGFDNSQMYFLKLDSTGQIMWSKSHGGTGQEWGTSVINTSDGGYVGVGYTNSWGAGGFDFYMVKLDSFGGMEYETFTGGTDWDFAWDVIEVAPKEFVIAGETQSFGAGGKDGWLVKYNENTSQFDWDVTVGENSTDEYFKSVALGQNGTLFAAGGGVKPGRTDEDVLITRFNSLADTIWTKFYGDTLQDYANDIIAMTNGNFSFTGRANKIGFNPGIDISQIDTSGALIFREAWTYYTLGIGNKIMEIDNNRVAVAGTVHHSSSNSDIFVARSHPSGGIFDQGSTQGSLDMDNGNSSVFLNQDGFIITGSTNGYSSTFENIVLFKTDENGLIYDDQVIDHIQDSNNVNSIADPISSNSTITFNQKSKALSILESSQVGLIKIFDITGKTILVTVPNSNSINLSQYLTKGGIYIIRIEFKNDEVTHQRIYSF